MNVSQIVAGALVDFAEYLNSGPVAVPVGGGVEGSHVRSLLEFWAEHNGLDMSEADPKHWASNLKEPRVQDVNLKMTPELMQQINAMIQQAKADLVLRNGAQVRERYSAEKGVVRVERTEGNVFSTYGVHDMIMALCRRMNLVPEGREKWIVEFELFINRQIGTQLAVTYFDDTGLDAPGFEEVTSEYEFLARPIGEYRKPVTPAEPEA